MNIIQKIELVLWGYYCHILGDGVSVAGNSIFLQLGINTLSILLLILIWLSINYYNKYKIYLSHAGDWA